MPSRKLEDCDLGLQTSFLAIKADYESTHPDRTLIPICTYRSPNEQYQQWLVGRTEPGRILTDCDGIRKKSKHNVQPARAIDFAVMVGGKAVWDESFYGDFITLAPAYGLISGGNWRKLHDLDHLELPGAV